MKGTLKQEQELHKKFAEYRTIGEWYFLVTQLEEYVTGVMTWNEDFLEEFMKDSRMETYWSYL